MCFKWARNVLRVKPTSIAQTLPLSILYTIAHTAMIGHIVRIRCRVVMLGQHSSYVRSTFCRNLIATATCALQLYLTGTDDYDTFALHSRRSSAAAASMASNDLEERFKGIGLADSTAKWVAAYSIFDNIAISCAIFCASLEAARPPTYVTQFLTAVLHLAGLLSRTKN